MNDDKPEINAQSNQNQAGRPAVDPFEKDSQKPMPQGVEPMKKPAIHKRFAAWHRNLTKKQKIALLIVVLLLIAGACLLASKILSKQERAASQTQSVNKPPTTVPSKLTGLQVNPKVNDYQVTGVMIENSLDARPQSGLHKAGLVFEAVAEGGITRFLALYQDSSANYIGPVRSVRPYYLDIVASFDAAIAHVGGSPQALDKLRSLKLKDLDQFQSPGTYQRVGSRAAPHNVYTSSAKLKALQKQKGYTKSSYTGFEHDLKENKAATVKAKKINLNLSSPLYNVQYTYSSSTNSYNRSVGGAPHKDEKSGKRLSPKVVIAVQTTRGQNGNYSVYSMTGKGKVTIFQNGTVIKGTWKRSNNDQYVFKNAEGEVIKLAPGQAWMTLVTAGGVKYAP